MGPGPHALGHTPWVTCPGSHTPWHHHIWSGRRVRLLNPRKPAIVAQITYMKGASGAAMPRVPLIPCAADAPVCTRENGDGNFEPMPRGCCMCPVLRGGGARRWQRRRRALLCPQLDARTNPLSPVGVLWLRRQRCAALSRAARRHPGARVAALREAARVW